MKIKTVAIDTCVWIHCVEDEPTKLKKDSLEMLSVCKKLGIQLYFSSRVFNCDTRTQPPIKQENMRRLISSYDAQEYPSPIRFDMYQFGSTDGFADPELSDNEKIFENIAGEEPVNHSNSNKLSNKIGDYDALKQACLLKLDVFTTYDKKNYFSQNKHAAYQKEFGLLVLNPCEIIGILNEQAFTQHRLHS